MPLAHADFYAHRERCFLSQIAKGRRARQYVVKRGDYIGGFSRTATRDDFRDRPSIYLGRQLVEVEREHR